ncbi:MAG: VCBS repeat-containing protein, partial [Planctomycetota bacterium]|nr:VCBS repeat-containing protein [Planctomycetota bacterium]
MKHTIHISIVCLLFSTLIRAEIPTFKTQEIDASLKIGYGVILIDISGDAKPDIVVADKERVVWFENPTWKLRVITQGKTAPDNVCIDAHDIDGDGKLDLALGAGWKPGNTKEPSTLQWLRRGKTLDEPWEMFPIAYEEPTLHRMRFADLDGGEKKVLITVPLMGRGSTKEKNWAEAGVKIQAHRIPNDPTKPDWPAETINDALHVPHNFQFLRYSGADLLVASYEGITHLSREVAHVPWTIIRISEGDQSNPNGSRGASEIKLGTRDDRKFPLIATVEPWHGHQVAAYIRGDTDSAWTRHVIDDQLRWGHAIWCADLDGDGADEIIVGVRDPLPGKAQHGVRVYRAADATGTKWDKSEL